MGKPAINYKHLGTTTEQFLKRNKYNKHDSNTMKHLKASERKRIEREKDIPLSDEDWWR
jgi:hypothetical protein